MEEIAAQFPTPLASYPVMAGESLWRILAARAEFDPFNVIATIIFALAALMCRDALDRNESCGGHFRAEYQTEDGEARRDDENYAYVAAWEFKGVGQEPVLYREPLVFEEVHPTQRSYK